MFESVDERTDGCRLDSYTISSPGAFDSGELKHFRGVYACICMCTYFTFFLFTGLIPV